MLRNISKAAVVLAVAVLATFCAGAESSNQSQSQDRAGDQDGIHRQVAAYEAALNRRDAAAVANLYTTDGDLVIYDQPRLVGRDAIRWFSEADLPSLSATWRVTIAVSDIRFLGTDMAIVETVATFNEGDVKEDRSTSVMVREGGNWLQAALRVFAAPRS